MTIEALETRCEALEINFAFQERLVRDLDDLVRALGGRLEEAERTIAQLKQAIAAGDPAVGPQDDPPPHY